MKLDKKAKLYAETLFNVAIKLGSEKAVKDSLALVNSTLKGSPEFRAFLLSNGLVKRKKQLRYSKFLVIDVMSLYPNLLD